MAAPAIETGVLREDRPLQLLQLAPGLDPELLYQDTARVGVRLERVRLAPRAVEGEDQQRAEALAQRVVEDQALELSRQLRVPAQLELGGEVLLQDGRAQLFESSDFALGKRGVSHVRERRPAPQRQALGQQQHRVLGRSLVERRSRLRHERLEAPEVQLALTEAELVPGRSRDQQPGFVAVRAARFEGFAQP